MGGQCCRAGGFRRAPCSRGHRRCQLSPGSCGWPARGHGDIPAAPRVPAVPAICAPPHPSQDPHAYSPPPGASPEQLLRIPPLAHIWATSGWGAAAPCHGGFRGAGCCRGGPWGPESARGGRDERGRCLGDSARAGRAAKGCRLMRRRHGGGVGSGSPPGCAHPKRTRATCGPWSTVAGAMAPPLSASGGHGNGQGVVAVTLRWLGPAGLVCAPPHMGGPGVLPGWWPASCWAGSRGRRDLTGMVAATLLGCCP